AFPTRRQNTGCSPVPQHAASVIMPCSPCLSSECAAPVGSERGFSVHATSIGASIAAAEATVRKPKRPVFQVGCMMQCGCTERAEADPDSAIKLFRQTAQRRA